MKNTVRESQSPPDEPAVIAKTITELFQARAEADPHALAYRFVTAARESTTLTWGELSSRSLQIAQALRSSGLEGQRVIVSPTSNLHFVIVFYGCMLAGVIAVPAPATTSPRRSERVRVLAEDAGANVLVGDADRVLDAARAAGLAALDSRELLRREPVAGGSGKWAPPAIDAASLAFLQYTSGSTNQPKGVMVSHGNVLANCKVIQVSMRKYRHSKKLCPLPLFHDMALVGSLLESLYAGFELTLVPPAMVVQQPMLWLKLISELGITHSGAPNFMFDLAASAMGEQKLDGVDLSGWICAYCGAEPIRSSTIARFTAAAQRYGFRPDAFYPCYGLAENTLFVSGAEAGTVPRFASDLGRQPVVSCGLPGAGVDVVIVDPVTRRPRSEGHEGEIWVGGDSVSMGYWARPEVSQQVCAAELEGSSGRYLRTGDLGVLRDGQLYVTGRLKDIIILRGRKYSPQDIEIAAESGHPAIQAAAAVSVDTGGQELLIVTVELSRKAWHDKAGHDEIRRSVGRSISEALDLIPAAIIMTTPQAIPRTTSGKLKRAALKLDYSRQADDRATGDFSP